MGTCGNPKIQNNFVIIKETSKPIKTISEFPKSFID